MLAFGIEFPKRHDVSGVFKALSRRRDVPSWFSSAIDELAENISTLAEVRSLAGYAYEEVVDADYFKEYAPTAHRSARSRTEACRRLLGEKFKLDIEEDKSSR